MGPPPAAVNFWLRRWSKISVPGFRPLSARRVATNTSCGSSELSLIPVQSLTRTSGPLNR